MVSPVTRVPPPPLLDLAIPSVALLPDPDRTPTLETNTILETDMRASTSKRHAFSNTATATVTDVSALQRLIDLLHRIDVEMGNDIARVKLAIGEAEDDIKTLRAERAHTTSSRASLESTRSVPGDDARNQSSMC